MPKKYILGDFSNPTDCKIVIKSSLGTALNADRTFFNSKKILFVTEEKCFPVELDSNNPCLFTKHTPFSLDLD